MQKIMKKENKVVRVDELSVNSYLNDGYDLVEIDETEKKYVIIKPARGKVVPYEEHLKILKELEELKAELAKSKTVKK